MADPRFTRNHGPFTVADLAAKLGAALAPTGDGAALIADLASLEGAGPRQISFFSGARDRQEIFALSHAGFCLVPQGDATPAPAGMVTLAVPSVEQGWRLIAATFYPQAEQPNATGIAANAEIGEDVQLADDAVIGEAAEIGAGSHIDAAVVIGLGVAIGRHCQIGANVTITNAYVGDHVVILPGARIGQPGGQAGVPQLGRVIIQDRARIGADASIERGALGDTVIGEGSRIDMLAAIGHDARIGRGCVVIAGAEVPPGTVYEDGTNSGASPAKPLRDEENNGQGKGGHD